MWFWKTTVLTAALSAAAALGAASSPSVQGQGQKTQPRAAAQQEARAMQFLSGGRSEIGISIHDLGDGDLKSGKTTGGAAIASVAEDGPAAKAGMKAGDIVTEFDGERIRSARQFARVVEETPAGRKVQAVVVRDGQKMTMTVQPSDRGGYRLLSGNLDVGDLERSLRLDIPTPPAPPVPPAAPRPPRPAIPNFEDFFGRGASRLGITVDELSPQLADYFGAHDGVLVRSVTDGSTAAKAGLKAGDVVTSVNGETVTSPSDLRRRIERLDEGAEFTLGIVRDKKPITLKGKLEARQERQRTYRS